MGVLSQANSDIAATTRAVLWNAGSLGWDLTSGPPTPSGPLAVLLHAPFAELGSAQPEFDAALAAHTCVGMLSDYLWRCVEPTDADVDRITAFCLPPAP